MQYLSSQKGSRGTLTHWHSRKAHPWDRKSRGSQAPQCRYCYSAARTVRYHLRSTCVTKTKTATRRVSLRRLDVTLILCRVIVMPCCAILMPCRLVGLDHLLSHYAARCCVPLPASVQENGKWEGKEGLSSFQGTCSSSRAACNLSDARLVFALVTGGYSSEKYIAMYMLSNFTQHIKKCTQHIIVSHSFDNTWKFPDNIWHVFDNIDMLCNYYTTYA